MSQDTEHKRTVDARIARLRQRLIVAKTDVHVVASVLKGILDLLDDELVPTEPEQ